MRSWFVKITEVLDLHPHAGIAHLALDLGAGCQCRHGVDHHHVKGIAAHEGLHNLEGLLAELRLREEEIVDVHAELLRIVRVQRVLGVDERTDAPQLLRLGNDMKTEGGLPGRLRPEYLGDTAPGYPADAQGGVQGNRPRGNGFHLGDRTFPQPHDGTLAVLLLDLIDGDLQRLSFGLFLVCHGSLLNNLWVSLRRNVSVSL